MDMDTMIFEMRENELTSMKNLLAQYQKEICDIKSRTGIAKSMTKDQLWEAEKNLESHIESLSESIIEYQQQHNYVF